MKCLRVKYETNNHVDIPIDLIADNRAKYYTKHYQRPYNELYQESLFAFTQYECLVEHWLMSKMSWQDISKLIEKAGGNISEAEWKLAMKEIQNIKI